MMKNLIILLVVAFACTQAADIDPLLTGGANAILGEFPSAVLIRTPGRTPPFCGGTLVNSRHVLTNAGCMMSAQNRLISAFWFQVILGDTNIVRSVTSTRRSEMNVTHIFIHPQYNFLTRNNDLAILRLGQAIPGFHNTIEVARRNIRLLPDATICRLAGWGTLNAQIVAPMQPQLRAVNSPILATAACNAANVHQNRVLSNMICAGSIAATNPASGPCNGNLGSGLYCNGFLTGVLTNFGVFGCGAANNPGVYIDVRQYETWIVQQFNRTDLPQVGWSPT